MGGVEINQRQEIQDDMNNIVEQKKQATKQQEKQNEDNYNTISGKFGANPESVLKSLKGSTGEKLKTYFSTNKSSALKMYTTALESENNEKMDRKDKKAIRKIKELIESKLGSEESIKKEIGKVQLEEEFGNDFGFNDLKAYGESFQKGGVTDMTKHTSDWFKNIPEKYNEGDNKELEKKLDGKYYSAEDVVGKLYEKNEERRNNISDIVANIDITGILEDIDEETIKNITNANSDVAKEITNHINGKGGKLASYWEYEDFINPNIIKTRKEEIDDNIKDEAEFLDEALKDFEIETKNADIETKNGLKREAILNKLSNEDSKSTEYNKNNTQAKIEGVLSLLKNNDSDKSIELSKLLGKGDLEGFQETIYNTTKSDSPKKIDGMIGPNTEEKLKIYLKEDGLSKKVANAAEQTTEAETKGDVQETDEETHNKKVEDGSKNGQATVKQHEETSKKTIAASKNNEIEQNEEPPKEEITSTEKKIEKSPSQSIMKLKSFLKEANIKKNKDVRTNGTDVIIPKLDNNFYKINTISALNNISRWDGTKFNIINDKKETTKVQNKYNSIRVAYLQRNRQKMNMDELDESAGKLNGSSSKEVKMINLLVGKNLAFDKDRGDKYNDFYKKPGQLNTLLNSTKLDANKKNTIAAYSLSKAIDGGAWFNDHDIIYSVLNNDNKNSRDDVAKKYNTMTNNNLWEDLDSGITGLRRTEIENNALGKKIEEKTK